jgi:membrane protein
MKNTIKNFWGILKATIKEWNNKDPFRQSAVIAYYAIFSIPGLLVLIVAVAGYFFGREEVSENILAQISGTMGPDTAAQIKDILEKSSASKSTLFGSIVGVLVLLLGATGVFIELQKTLNMIWHVETTPKKGIWPIIKARLFSFGLIMAIAFLLLISLVISTVITLITDMIKVEAMSIVAVLVHVLNFAISLGVISFLFALIFKILPDAKIQWRHVWFGAILTGLLFTIGKTALTFYFDTAEPASAYGAAGSVILILLWVSYSSMIVFFGAEFTFQYAGKLSGKVAPTEIAKKMPASKIQVQL